MKFHRNPYFFGILSVLAWSTVATAFKISFNYLSVVQVLCLSILFSFVAILIATILLGKFNLVLQKTRPQWLFSALMGLLNPILYYFVLFSAYDSLPAQEAMIINYTWPIFFGITSAIISKSKISKSLIIAFFVSFSGVVLIATRGNFVNLSFSNLWGDLLALSSALIWTLFWIINLKDQRDAIVKLFSTFMFGTLYALIIMIFTQSFANLNFFGLIASIYIGFFEMGITFILWLMAISLSHNPHKIGQLVYLTPFLSLMIIALVLGEHIHFSSIFGLILIIFGILLQQNNK